MAALICKMCCAPLEIVEEDKLAKCTYCGTMYTLPMEDFSEEALLAKAEIPLERARMFLADGKFSQAADYYERALDIMPSLGEAWLGKGLALLEEKDIPGLSSKRREAARNYYIKKALIFCTGQQQDQLYKVLGIVQKQKRHEQYMNQWSRKAQIIRRDFIQELRTKLKSSSPEYVSAAAAIDEKYSDDFSALRKTVESFEQLIIGQKEKQISELTVEEVESSASIIQGYKKEIDIAKKIPA